MAGVIVIGLNFLREHDDRELLQQGFADFMRNEEQLARSIKETAGVKNNSYNPELVGRENYVNVGMFRIPRSLNEPLIDTFLYDRAKGKTIAQLENELLALPMDNERKLIILDKLKKNFAGKGDDRGMAIELQRVIDCPAILTLPGSQSVDVRPDLNWLIEHDHIDVVQKSVMMLSAPGFSLDEMFPFIPNTAFQLNHLEAYESIAELRRGHILKEL